MDIQFSGFGGQGIIKSGILIGKAASLHDNKFGIITLTVSNKRRP